MPKQALIMIDMQRGFLDSASPLCIPSAEATVTACAALIDRCHAAGVPQPVSSSTQSRSITRIDRCFMGRHPF